MYTSVSVLALSSVLAFSGTEGSGWAKDYGAARKLAASAGKPVAVFFGSGATGYEKVARDGGLNAATRNEPFSVSPLPADALIV